MIRAKSKVFDFILDFFRKENLRYLSSLNYCSWAQSKKIGKEEILKQKWLAEFHKIDLTRFCKSERSLAILQSGNLGKKYVQLLFLFGYTALLLCWLVIISDKAIYWAHHSYSVLWNSYIVLRNSVCEIKYLNTPEQPRTHSEQPWREFVADF